MQTLELHIPDKLLQSKGKQELEALAYEALLVKLFQQGEISSGYAADALGISRRTFMDLLAGYGVTISGTIPILSEEANYS